MGADFIGWRDCALQADLGPDGFLGKLKLRAYKRVVEERVPVERRDTIQIKVQITGRGERTLTYPQICADLAAFEAGVPECRRCPLANGRPLGCYRYVTYPIDAVTEELVYDFFAEELKTRDSIGDQIHRDIVSQIDDESGFIHRRGEGGGTLAAREEPLVGEAADGRPLHSGKLLAALFIPLEVPPLVVAYARLFFELQQYAARRVDGDSALAHRVAESRSLDELAQIADLVGATLPRAIDEGWSVVVDG
jgi:hypothetical protein